MPLSTWYKTYNWVKDDGYNNFSKWLGLIQSKGPTPTEIGG